MSVSDHTAVVTGAGSKRGIGRATAHALAAAGWNIAVLDLDEAGAKGVATEIAEEYGVRTVGVACDVTDAASVENALTVVEDAVPPVGAVIFCSFPKLKDGSGFPARCFAICPVE